MRVTEEFSKFSCAEDLETSYMTLATEYLNLFPINIFTNETQSNSKEMTWPLLQVASPGLKEKCN